MLEKHVKLTDNPKDVVEINGRKICYNYRKGRCKFGHKCKYAHDSDLSVNAVKVPQPGSEASNSNLHYNAQVSNGKDEVTEEEERKRKKKPGLSESLVPNKKSRANFASQQNKESPWLMKR